MFASLRTSVSTFRRIVPAVNQWKANTGTRRISGILFTSDRSASRSFVPLKKNFSSMAAASSTSPALSDRPRSCDTFVVLPPASSNGCIIFGKNSDRLPDEVQEVVHVPAQDHAAGSRVQCTYMELLQVPHTHAVILSKPSWMWGAEMGANEHGVCIGNEAVWTKLNGPDDSTEKLLGMDLVRLGLERGGSAREALDIVTALLTEHGQGGPCHESLGTDPAKNIYHNSFLIADQSEAWVLETAGDQWATEQIKLALERGATAELAVQVITGMLSLYGQGGNNVDRLFENLYHNSFLVADRKMAFVVESVGNNWAVQNVESGYRNISNQLTIRTKIDKKSEGLDDMATDRGWWSPDQGDLDFAKTFSDYFEETEVGAECDPDNRQLWGTKLLDEFSSGGNFKVQDMLTILRHEDSGICMSGGLSTTGSQVSILPPADSGAPCVHLFTGTSNPNQSLYKPFVFCENAGVGDKTTSPTYGDTDPAKVVPRFQSEVDRRHPLWLAHENFTALLEKNDPRGEMLLHQIREMEASALGDLEDIVNQGKLDAKAAAKLSHLFQHMVDLEINFYKMS